MKAVIGVTAFGIMLALVAGVFAGYANAEDGRRTWSTECEAGITQNDDGTYTFSRSGRTVSGEGRVATHSAQKQIIRGENGYATWTGTRPRTNPRWTRTAR